MFIVLREALLSGSVERRKKETYNLLNVPREALLSGSSARFARCRHAAACFAVCRIGMRFFSAACC